MALLHPRSCETIHTGLDLFSVPPTQTSVAEGQFIEHHPISTLTSSAPIEFHISGGGGEYLDLCHTFLHVRAKIVKPDGTVLKEGDDKKVMPVNYWLHSLFSQVDVTMNDVLVTPSENTYPYKAYIEATLNYGKEAKESHMTSAFFYADTPGKFDEVETNAGGASRNTLTTRSQEVDMIGRLHVAVGVQERYIINGVDVKIRLIPSKPQFHLLVPDDTKYTTQITHASLFVRKVKPNPAVSTAIERALQKDTAKYPMKRVLIKSFAIPTGSMHAVQDNLFLSQLPTRLVIGLVSSEAFNGAYKANPFNFETKGLSFLSVYVDGHQVPSTPLTPDFENKRWVRSYFNQSAGMGLVNKDAGTGISYSDFAEGYALYVFDLTPTLLDGSQSELIKSGALRVEVKFNKALTSGAHALVYGELDSLLEIDRSRQILTDFSS